MNPLGFIVKKISKPLHRFEYDPVFQFKFNFFFVWFWFCTMIGAAIKVPKHTPTEMIAFMVLEVSLWANFISHLGALSASIAAIFGANRQGEIPGLAETHTNRPVFSEDQVTDIVAQIIE